MIQCFFKGELRYGAAVARPTKRIWRRVESNELLREDFSLKQEQGLVHTRDLERRPA
jgi:hypothetical protein